ncbi:MAG: NUDIX hydrolase [Gemmatimonadaceae bacterium]
MTVRVLTGDARGMHTLELLDAYHPVGERERQHLHRMRELLATTQTPFSREQYEPGHFTASALVMSRTHGHILLIAHPTLGLWLQPGGHLEPDDAHPRAGAHREVFEETGLAVVLEDALFDIDIHEIPHRGSAPAHLHFDLRFLASVDGLPDPAGSEGVDARWLSAAEAEGLATDESVRQMLIKGKRVHNA